MPRTMHIARHAAESSARSTPKPAGLAPAPSGTSFGAALKPATEAASAPAPVAPPAAAPKPELGSGLSTLALAGAPSPAA